MPICGLPSSLATQSWNPILGQEVLRVRRYIILYMILQSSETVSIFTLILVIPYFLFSAIYNGIRGEEIASSFYLHESASVQSLPLLAPLQVQNGVYVCEQRKFVWTIFLWYTNLFLICPMNWSYLLIIFLNHFFVKQDLLYTHKSGNSIERLLCSSGHWEWFIMVKLQPLYCVPKNK